MIDAEHEESAPTATTLLISQLSCSLVGQIQPVHLVAGSQIAAAYGQATALEDFRCNYGFNVAFTEHFRQSALRFVAFDDAGDLRALELPGQHFYIATLFLPQLRSQPGAPHPLIKAYLQAASDQLAQGAD
jgi:CTP synthase (UTP-ammonia lyase)